MWCLRRRARTPSEQAFDPVLPEPGEWFVAEPPEDQVPVEVDWAGKDSQPIDYSHLRGADPATVQAAADRMAWFHRIELPGGVVTPGLMSPEEPYQLMGIPAAIKGKSVLDVGTGDGGFAFLCERDGAARVVACDVDSHLELDLGRGPAYQFYLSRYLQARQKSPQSHWVFLNGRPLRFWLAHTCLQSKVERVHARPDQLSPERVGRFAVTLVMGHFHHLRNPLAALDALYSVTEERSFLSSEVDLDQNLGVNGLAFYPEAYRNDCSNWFIPTPRCLVGMLQSVGYRRVRHIAVRGTTAYLEAVV